VFRTSFTVGMSIKYKFVKLTKLINEVYIFLSLISLTSDSCLVFNLLHS